MSALSEQEAGATIFTLKRIMKAFQNAPEFTVKWVMYSKVDTGTET